jgi:hypothetical protein
MNELTRLRIAIEQDAGGSLMDLINQYGDAIRKDEREKPVILLKQNEDYFMLKDLEGRNFASHMIIKGVSKVFDIFEYWAENDDMDISNYRLADLAETWNVEILKYRGANFEKLTKEELTITNK